MFDGLWWLDITANPLQIACKHLKSSEHQVSSRLHHPTRMYQPLASSTSSHGFLTYNFPTIPVGYQPIAWYLFTWFYLKTGRCSTNVIFRNDKCRQISKCWGGLSCDFLCLLAVVHCLRSSWPICRGRLVRVEVTWEFFGGRRFHESCGC